MQNVDIIMATYNGGDYIENQLLSLFQQTYKNWTLYIHDDGSTDQTIQIIKKYSQIDKRIIFIDDVYKGLKVGKNFLHTLAFSKADYAIFCDQDDIWLENKIEELLKLMLTKDQVDKPVLVYCDGYAWSDKGFIYQESISTNHANKLEDFLFFNGGYQGCSMMLNRKLIDMVNNYKGYIYHHDDIVSLIAHSFGDVIFLPKQLMLYRQHENAVTGNKNFRKSKISSLFNNSGFVVSALHYKVKKDFFNFFYYDLNERNKELFLEYFSICEMSSRVNRIINIVKTNFTYGGSKFKIIFKIIFQDIFSK